MTHTKEVVYLSTEGGHDPAIARGIERAGLTVWTTFRIADTVAALRNGHKGSPLLISDVQAGALALLRILSEQGTKRPATVLFDRVGDDIQAPIAALQHGVTEYLLASDPELQREMRVRVLAERVVEAQDADQPASAQESPAFQWDAESHVINTGTEIIRLSPTEGRIFTLLLANRGKTVTTPQLLEHALDRPGMPTIEGVKLLRPHVVRLRNRFDHYKALANRIVNMRGSGYQLV